MSAEKQRYWLFFFACLVVAGLVLNVLDRMELERLRSLKTDDPGAFIKMVNEIETELKSIPSSEHDANLRLYRRLALLDEENPRYRAKIIYYENKKAALERARELEEERRERVERAKANLLHAAKETQKHSLGNFQTVSRCAKAQISHLMEIGVWGKHIEILNTSLGVARKVPTADGSVLLICDTKGQLTLTVHNY